MPSCQVSGEMNSVLGSGNLVVAPAGREHTTLLQAAVSGTKDSAAGPLAASISVSLWPSASTLLSPYTPHHAIA